MTQDAEQINRMHREMHRKVDLVYIREVQKRVTQRLASAQRRWNELGKTLPKRIYRER